MPPLACDKVSYCNPTAAWRAIYMLTRPTALLTHKRLHRRCRPYRCEYCHQWHLTHQLPPKRPSFAELNAPPRSASKSRLLQQLMRLDQDQAEGIY